MWRHYQLENLPVESWRALAGRSLLQSLDWLKLWYALNYQPEFFLSEPGDSCGFAVMRTGSGPFTRRQAMIDGLPGGLLLEKAKADDRDIRCAALEALAAVGVARTVVVDYHNAFSNANLPAGWRSAATSTQRIDLRSAAEFSSEAGRHIRSARERGAVVRPIQSSAEVNRFFELQQQTHQRYGRTRAYPLSLYKGIYDLSRTDDRIVWLVCEVEGDTIGSHLALIENDEMISWAPVMDHDHRDKKPAYALLNHLIAVARERGLSYLNLGGSPAEAEGLRRFKARFGATDYHYQTLIHQPRWARALGIGRLG